MEIFLSVVSEYKNGSLSQEKALGEIEKIFDSAVKVNDQKITNITEKYKYYEDIQYTKDELIIMYDKSINCPAESERKEYDERLKEKIKDISFERMTMVQFDESESITNRDFELLRDSIYQERTEVAELCQENRKNKKYYDMAVEEIVNINPQKVKEPKLLSQKATLYGDPKWIQEQYNRTLQILLIDKCIYKHIDKDGNFEYRISETYDAPKIQYILKRYKEKGKIELPEIEDIDSFMITFLRLQSGNTLHHALRVKKNRPDKKSEGKSEQK